MASKNVDTLRAAHESWNKREFAGLTRNVVEGLVYTDNARALTFNSPDKFREWTEGWAKAFSDGRITKPGVNLAGLQVGAVVFHAAVTDAVGKIVRQVSVDPPKYLVRLLFSFRGVDEMEVPEGRIVAK